MIIADIQMNLAMGFVECLCQSNLEETKEPSKLLDIFGEKIMNYRLRIYFVLCLFSYKMREDNQFT